MFDPQIQMVRRPYSAISREIQKKKAEAECERNLEMGEVCEASPIGFDKKVREQESVDHQDTSGPANLLGKKSRR